MSAPHDAIILMARAPEPGRVKTRLAAEMGDEQALAIYRELAEGVAAALRKAGPRVTVSFTPTDAEPMMRDWLGDDFRYEPQGSGDVGARMASAIASRFAAGADRVVVVGSDCPTMTPEALRAAFSALADADVVLGPAMDGGYYLVGVSAPQDALFHDVPWSSGNVLRVSLERARDAGLRVTMLPEMRDIDTAADWRAHREAEWTRARD